MARRVSGLRWVAVLALLIGTAGCSSSASDVPAPASPAAPSSSQARAVVPSHAPDPSAVPVTGTQHRVGPVTIVLPAAFASTGDTGNDSFRLAQFTAPDPVAVVEVTRTATTSTDLGDLAAAAIADNPLAPTRLADREVGGQQVYAAAGSDDFTGLYYVVGREVGGQRTDIAFSFQVDSPENQALIESVLATVTWRR